MDPRMTRIVTAQSKISSRKTKDVLELPGSPVTVRRIPRKAHPLKRGHCN